MAINIDFNEVADEVFERMSQYVYPRQLVSMDEDEGLHALADGFVTPEDVELTAWQLFGCEISVQEEWHDEGAQRLVGYLVVMILYVRNGGTDFGFVAYEPEPTPPPSPVSSDVTVEYAPGRRE